jgi:hypothetical protein
MIKKAFKKKSFYKGMNKKIKIRNSISLNAMELKVLLMKKRKRKKNNKILYLKAK